MEEKLYNVVFLGPAQSDINRRHKLVEEMTNRFKLSNDYVKDMIEKAPITLKKGLTINEAERYRVVFESVGAQVIVEPVVVASEEQPVFWSATDTEASRRKSIFEGRSFYTITLISIIIAIFVILGLVIHKL